MGSICTHKSVIISNTIIESIETLPSPPATCTALRVGTFADPDETDAKKSSYGFTKHAGKLAVVAMMYIEDPLEKTVMKTIQSIAQSKHIDYHPNFNYHMFVCQPYVKIERTEDKHIKHFLETMYVYKDGCKHMTNFMNDVCNIMNNNHIGYKIAINFGIISTIGFMSEIVFDTLQIIKNQKQNTITTTDRVNARISISKIADMMEKEKIDYFRYSI